MKSRGSHFPFRCVSAPLLSQPASQNGPVTEGGKGSIAILAKNAVPTVSRVLDWVSFIHTARPFECITPPLSVIDPLVIDL